MGGFLVEIFTTHESAKRRTWLTERDGCPCVVSVRDQAQIFATLNEARLAGNNYVNTHVEQIMDYEVRAT